MMLRTNVVDENLLKLFSFKKLQSQHLNMQYVVASVRLSCIDRQIDRLKSKKIKMILYCKKQYVWFNMTLNV